MKKYDIIPYVAAICLLFGASGCGDNGEPERVYPDRMDDPQYQAALSNQMGRFRKLASKRSPLVAKMEKLEADGKTESEEWKKLKAEVEALNDEIEKNRLENRAIVRARILKELEDKKKISTETSK